MGGTEATTAPQIWGDEKGVGDRVVVGGQRGCEPRWKGVWPTLSWSSVRVGLARQRRSTAGRRITWCLVPPPSAIRWRRGDGSGVGITLMYVLYGILMHCQFILLFRSGTVGALFVVKAYESWVHSLLSSLRASQTSRPRRQGRNTATTGRNTTTAVRCAPTDTHTKDTFIVCGRLRSSTLPTSPPRKSAAGPLPTAPPTFLPRLATFPVQRGLPPRRLCVAPFGVPVAVHPRLPSAPAVVPQPPPAGHVRALSGVCPGRGGGCPPRCGLPPPPAVGDDPPGGHRRVHAAPTGVAAGVGRGGRGGDAATAWRQPATAQASCARSPGGRHCAFRRGR